MTKITYLDNNATTQVAPEILEAMMPYFSQNYGNPSSLYQFGTAVHRAIEQARELVAQYLGAKSEREIIFTSGGTESNHTAFHSAIETVPNRKRIVTTQIEHSSVRNLYQALEKKGFEVISIGVSKSGAIDWNAFQKSLTSDVALVSIMWANNETGVLFPIDKIAKEVKANNLLLHVDAVQAVGKIPIELRNIPIDYLSISAHKFHGPKGIGALYVREGVPFSPLFLGGKQERDRRAGTENVPGIIGFSKALKLSVNETIPQSANISALRNRLEDQILKHIPDSFVNGKEEERIPNTTNITIPGIESETLLIRLSESGICASSGSACLTGALEPSHVLMAMGHSRELALNSIRLSLSRYTTQLEIDQSVKILAQLVTELRSLKEV